MQEARIKQVRLVCVWENTLVEVAAGAETREVERAQSRESAGPGPWLLPAHPISPGPLPPEASQQVPSGEVGRARETFSGSTLGVRGQEEFTPSLPRRKGRISVSHAMTGLLTPGVLDKTRGR